MSTLTFTFNNTSSPAVAITAALTFTATTTTKSCNYELSINGGAYGAPQAVTDMTAAEFPGQSIPAGQTLAVRLSGVTGVGTLTGMDVTNTATAYLTTVATSDSGTGGDWGLGGITSFASTFATCTRLVSVPDHIPSTVLSLANMFNDADGINDPNISLWNTSFVTNMSGLFALTNGASAFNQNIGTWNVSSVTTFANMFSSATTFNNNGAAMPWTTIGSAVTGNIVNMSGMFAAATAFNADISLWNTGKVFTMQNMFNGATIFNKDISVWNVNAVTNMNNMFDSAAAFNAPIQYWNTGTSSYTQIIQNATAFQATYGPPVVTANYAYPTLPSAYFNVTRPTRYPCFMKGTQILCLRAEEEVYRPVQDLRKGDLVKTYRNGYLPIHMIGTSSLSNPGDDERTTNRLYKCSKELYPSLFEDLYITGCHSILVPALTNDQWENTKDMLGNVYITDNHFRLMACIDEKAQPFQRDAMIDIYHIALENEDYYMNYGIYANGLLVETCSKRYLTELSNMRIIGEDEACYDAPSVNVFSELSSFIQC